MAGIRAAGIYARISSDKDGTAAGVERQLADCRKLADTLGWPVADEYVDNDVSAYSGKPRPQYRRMLADIEGATIDAVLVYHPDRLTRQNKELEEFIDVLDAAKVTAVRFVAGDMDLGTSDGLLIARIQAAVASNESASKSRRVRRKLDEIAQRGMPHGTPRPYGYEPDRMTIRTSEARIVQQIVSRYLAGESLRSIARSLTDAGVPTSSGGPWESSAVKRILSSPRYAGLRTHRGQVVGKAAWPAIITDDEHRRVLLRLEERKVSGRRAPRRYVLSGMLRCGRCGGRLFSAARVERRRYVCMSGPDHGGGCGKMTITATPVEELIADAVLYRLDTPELAAALAAEHAGTTELAQVSEVLAADKAQLEELSQLYAARRITAAEWMTARSPIQARIDAAERRLAKASNHTDLVHVIGQGGRLRTEWPTLNLDRQAAIIAAVLDHAVVTTARRGPTFDPARVSPVWRL